MILHGSIKTTKPKAIAMRSELEKLITKAKKGSPAMNRDIMSHLPDRAVVAKLMGMAQTQFASRQSGFTRMIKLDVRRGDATQVVHLSFVDEGVVEEVIPPVKKTKPVAKVEKKATKKTPVKKETKKSVTKKK
jgi:large subunit ribosomal protein L17